MQPATHTVQLALPCIGATGKQTHKFKAQQPLAPMPTAAIARHNLCKRRVAYCLSRLRLSVLIEAGEFVGEQRTEQPRCQPTCN